MTGQGEEAATKIIVDAKSNASHRFRYYQSGSEKDE
jgi:hypothetical protein